MLKVETEVCKKVLRCPFNTILYRFRIACLYCICLIAVFATVVQRKDEYCFWYNFSPVA